jgi:alpha-glucosidase
MLVTQPKLTETPKLDTLPVFVRAGTILPRQPLVQSTAETPQGPLMLDVYPGPDCSGEIYLDDGISIGGRNLRQQIRCTASATGVVLQFGQRSGTYNPWWKQIAVTVHGWRAPNARVEGRSVNTDSKAQTLSFTIPDHPAQGEVAITSN